LKRCTVVDADMTGSLMYTFIGCRQMIGNRTAKYSDYCKATNSGQLCGTAFNVFMSATTENDFGRFRIRYDTV